MKVNLSDRIRPNSEAAQWVVEEVKQMEDRIKRLEKALIPFAQIGDIADDPDCTLWKRSVSAGSVREARKALQAKEDKP